MFQIFGPNYAAIIRLVYIETLVNAQVGCARAQFPKERTGHLVTNLLWVVGVHQNIRIQHDIR